MEYEKVKGIVEAVQHLYQTCTHIFDGLRNPRADYLYVNAEDKTEEEKCYAKAERDYDRKMRERRELRNYNRATEEQVNVWRADDAKHIEEFRKMREEYESRSEQEVRGDNDRRGQYLRKNHLMDAADLHSKLSKFKSSIRTVHDKFDSNLYVQTDTTVLDNIPTCYDRILREWKNESLQLRGVGDSDAEQLNQAVAQVEASIVAVIIHAMKEVSVSLQQETGGNQFFEQCKSKLDAAAKPFASQKAYTYKDMIIVLCDIQDAIVNWHAYGQNRTSPAPTEKIKIMQSIVRICIFSQPDIFNNEKDLDPEIRKRLNEAPSCVTLDAHVSPITLKLAQLHQMTHIY